MKLKQLLTIILISVFVTAFAQDETKEEKNFKFAGIPLVNYNRTVELIGGVILNGYYKINKEDTISPSSSTSLIGVYTTNQK